MAPLTASTSPSHLDYLHHTLQRRASASTQNVIDSSELSGGAKAGIALGVIVPVILLGLILFYLYTHSWQIPHNLGQRTELIWPRSRRKLEISAPLTWGPKSWHRVASVTDKTSSLESRTIPDDEPPKLDVEVSERPAPGKWWSANEIGTAGEKNNTGRSRFSVVAPPWETHEPKVVKAPRPPSIFTSKTSIYGGERSAEPEVVRPGSRKVKTRSRHISAQFADLGRFGRTPTIRSPTIPRAEGLKEDVHEEAEVPTLNKRDSKAVVTNLDWQDFDISEVPRVTRVSK